MALTDSLSPNSHSPQQDALPDLALEKAPVVQPSYSFEGNDSETVIDVHLPGVQRPDISVQLVGQDLVILGKCFASGNKGPQRPSLEYALHVQLDAPIHRKSVKAALRSFDTLRVRIPATPE